MSDTDINRDWSGLEILGDAECIQLLTESAVGRLGFVEQGGPIILPVNFAMDGRSIAFRTGIGSKLSIGMMQRPVCFEVDAWDTMSHTGWSVLAKGIADEVVDDEVIERLDSLPVQPWSRPDVRDHWIRILVEELSGRRVNPVA